MKPTNLIIIMSDEHNPKVMGCNGHPLVKTPNIDALAAATCQGEVEVDVSAASFIDSSGIGVLVAVVRDGLYISVVGANETVRRAFEIAGVGRLLNLDS